MKKVCFIKPRWSCSRRLMDYLDILRYASLNRLITLPENDLKKAEYAVIVTCGSCDYSERLSLESISRLRKYLPENKIIVLGCVSKTIPDFQKKFAGIAVSPSEYNDKLDNAFVRAGILKKVIHSYSSIGHSCQGFDKYIPFLSDKHWYLYTSTGCLGNCGYCRIKRAVGVLKSEPLESIIKSFSQGVSSGYEFFWPTGDDLGAYGLDIGLTFPHLLKVMIKRGKDLGGRFKLDCRTIINTRWLERYKNETLSLIKSYPEIIISFGVGIQSFIPRLLKLSRRYPNVNQFNKTLLKIKRVNPQIFLC